MNGQDTTPLLIQDEMKGCFLDYAMSVIVSRALPDMRDGLKPVHRRVLYTMHRLGNFKSKPYLKSARVVGDVMGKLHPHGDSSIYGTMVRLAQDFTMRYPIVDGQGNFGSIDGDEPAAMRYTEVRMQLLAEDVLKDIDKDTVDWTENYDGSMEEPTVLPSRIPNLLINGASGIAVGMATNIPPHNLSEILTGLIAIIDDPSTSLGDLMKIIPGPDFPTGGSILGTQGIQSAYFNGRGVIQVKAQTEIETYQSAGRERERIIVTELPYQVNKAKLIEKMAALVNNKELQGISDIRDESNRLGIRVVIEIKRGEMASVVLNRLLKQTQLQVSYGIIFLALHNGRPQVMNLRELLQGFVEHRREVVIRRTYYELHKAEEKAHILEGLKIAVENMDAIIKLIKASPGPKEAKEQLIQSYELSQIQAQAILDMRLQRLTGLEREKILEDYRKILAEIARLKELLSSDRNILGVVKEEFQELLEQFGDERRTKIQPFEGEIQLEDLIKEEEVIVVITHKGYIKRMAVDTYKAQKRGGKGVRGADMVEEDFINEIFTANTHSMVMFFTSSGMVYGLKVYEIPEGARTSKGRNIVNLIPLQKGDRVKAILPIPRDDTGGEFLLMATEKGYVKKSAISEYRNLNKNGLRAIRVQEDDTVMGVALTDGKQDVFLSSSSGKVIRFAEAEARSMGRVSQGVRGMGLGKNDRIVGLLVASDESQVEILTVTEKGHGKRTKFADYRKQGRAGQGIIGLKTTSKNGPIAGILSVQEDHDLMIITSGGQVIRMPMADIPVLGRNTQGVRLIGLRSGERVVAIETLEDEGEAEN